MLMLSVNFELHLLCFSKNFFLLLLILFGLRSDSVPRIQRKNIISTYIYRLIIIKGTQQQSDKIKLSF